LKRAWKRFWRLGSLALIFLIITVVSLGSAGAKEQGRVNELTLAGLRPGRDKIESPKKAFRGLERDETATDGYVWGDICTHRDLRVEVDAHHLVRTVTVSTYYKPEIMAKCLETMMAPERLKELKSGHGLLPGDACSRVTDIYGKPDSETPSVKGTDQLQLLFYSFGWAGSDVPQVMEISCSQAAGKVVEIMLAASSL
jgi:hypothetical protein